MFHFRNVPLTRCTHLSNFLLLLLVFWGVSPTLSRAATFNITDGDVAVLKTAINTANGTAEADIINLATNGTYTLTVTDNTGDDNNGLPILKANLTINGNGATIQRSAGDSIAAFRIFQVDGTGVVLNGLTIANGKVSDSFDGDGGGILNNGVLTVTNCTLRDNVAALSGGGIESSFNSDGLTVNGCTFTANTANTTQSEEGGGAISFDNGDGALSNSTFTGNSALNGGAVLTTFFSDFAAPITGCTFTNNTINGRNASGGALYNAAGVTLTGCTFTGNTATGSGAKGGAIYNDDDLSFSNCGFTSNSAPSGGALYNDGFETTLTDTTFITNTATIRGGALFGFGDLNLTNCTFNGNTAVGSGGAIENQSDITLLTCTFNDNTSLPGGSGGAIHNLDSNTNVTLTATNCAFNRSAAFNGGAISSGQGFLLLNNCTFTGGTAASGAGITLDSNGTGFLTGCTFTNNNANTPNANTSGGGIFNNGTLTLRTCAFNTNSAGTGGGLYNGSGVNNFVPAATVQNCTFEGNFALGSDFPLGQGGGIFNFGTLTVTGSTIKNNSAPLRGGGIASSNTGTLNLAESTLSGNSVTSTANANLFGFGGGVFINSIRANTIINCTFSANTVTNRGGGLFADVNTSAPGALTLTNSTFTLNSVSGTDASAGGGGIFTGTGVTTQIGNTLVAANTAATGPDVRGPVTSLGYNLIGDATAATGFTASGDQTGTTAAPINANLGPLADNGGPTLTHLPQSGSPAIDAGKQPATGASINDQRGFTRPVNQPGVTDAAGGDGSDIGALEIQVADTPQSGSTLVVNTVVDNFDGVCGVDNCSLREAIFAANAQAGNDVITFDANVFPTAGPAKTINLSRPLPDLASNVEIRGPGAAVLTVRRDIGGNYRIFTVPGGNTVIISGLTIAAGFANGARFPDDSGGGIFNEGTLTVIDCVLSGNTATISPVITTRGSGGGGIFNGGTLTLRTSTLSGNVTNGLSSRNSYGGGLFNEATATLDGVLLSGNVVNGNNRNPEGGGVFNLRGATLNVANSTFSGNSSSNPSGSNFTTFGGGLSNSGTATVVNSTFSGNNGGTQGGGIYNNGNGSPILKLFNCTLTLNSAVAGGGLSTGSQTPPQIGDTLIAGNSSSNTGTFFSPNVNGTIASQGFNFIGNGNRSFGFTAPSDQVGTTAAPLNPLLGDLQDNGGPTPTHALQSGSPAIDKGKDVAGFGVDQRGMPRPLGNPLVAGGDGSDIGAYETLGVMPTPMLSINNAPAVAEGNSGSANSATFTVTLAPASSGEVRVLYQTVSGSATEDVDFVRTNGQLIFTAGQTTKTISVPIKGDLIAEGDETFTVVLSAPVNATLNPNATTGTGTITDDDVAKLTLSITPSTFSEGAGATAATGTVTRNTPISGPLTVNLLSSNTAKVTVPATVVIPADAASATFALSAVDNTIVDGSKTVTITASSTGLTTATADVTVTDNDTNPPPPTNVPPVANNQSLTTKINTPLSITLTGSDSDTPVAQLTYRLVTPPANGVLSGSGANVTYTPKADFTGADSFKFVINDGNSDSNIATISLQVLAADIGASPVALDQTLSGPPNTPINITLTATDADTPQAQLTFRIAAQPKNGKLSGSALKLVYTPNEGFTGTDSFTFIANDGSSDSNIGTITLQVLAANVAPVANSQNLRTPQNTPLTFALTASDANNDALTFRIVSQPKNGKLSGNAARLTYTPNDGFSGSDTFTFVANDGKADSNVATITVQVLADTPVNQAPVAQSQTLRTKINTPLALALKATDANNDALTFRIVSQPKNGKLSGSAANLTYTPNDDFVGSDSFTFVANDGKADSNVATITVQVLAGGNPPPPTPTQRVQAVNDSYNLILGRVGQAQNAGVALISDGIFRIAPRGVLANDRALPGRALSARLTRGPQNGRLQLNADGSFDYQPSAGFAGTDEFSYQLSDGQNTDTARVRLIVLDRRGPELRFDTPTDGATGRVVREIRGRVRDRESGVKSVSVLWRREADGAFWNGSAWIDKATPLIAQAIGTNWKYEGDLPEPGDNRESDLLAGEYAMQATAMDNAGNTSRVLIRFTVDNSAPEMPEFSPVRLSSAGASAALGAIELRFTGALDAASATDSMNYAIVVNGVEMEIGAANYANNVVTLSGLSLNEGDAIELHIDGLRDATGKMLKGGAIQLIAR